jgi:hypothetical protein
MKIKKAIKQYWHDMWEPREVTWEKIFVRILIIAAIAAIAIMVD